MYLVGLHIYYKMIHGLYNIKFKNDVSCNFVPLAYPHSVDRDNITVVNDSFVQIFMNSCNVIVIASIVFCI